jgi:hypothetical protein
MKWKYFSTSLSGNFHSTVDYINEHHPEWDVVAMDMVGFYTIVVYREVLP